MTTLPTHAAPEEPSKNETPPDKAAPASSTEAIAAAASVPFSPKAGSHLVKFNLEDANLADLVRHMSALTGKRFVYGAKLRSVQATVVTPEPVTLDEAYRAFLSILEANGMTVVPQGAFFKIIDTANAASTPTPLIARGANVPDAERYLTRLHRLTHVQPAQVLPILSKFKSKDGDISSYDPGRLLIITDTGSQVRRLLRLIQEIDVAGETQRLWIEPIHSSSAEAFAKRLNEALDLGSAANATPEAPVLRPHGIVRILGDESGGQLIIVATEAGYRHALALIKRLDVEHTEEARVHVLPLQHGSAEELQKTLSALIAAPAPPTASAGHSSTAPVFEGEVRVTADKSVNSLLISASGRDYATLRLVISELDRARRQVFIEAVVMDLAVSDQTSLGAAFHAAGTASSGSGDSLLVGGFRSATSIAFPSTSDASLLQGLAAGVRGPGVAGTESLTGTGLSIPAFGVVIDAIASSGRSNVLATPHIIATDNVAAEISVGDNIPLQQNVGASALSALTGNSNTANNLGLLNSLSTGVSPQRQDVGTKVKVTPHINESNQVRLEIAQESSSAGAAVGALGVVPIQKRTATTTVVAEDQQTIVIGGLVRDEYVTSREKIPVLGDIPLLGTLFSHTTTTRRKSNLLLILTPHVIREQADLRRIFERKMRERQEFLDRHFVFGDNDWEPPRDWSRTTGLVEATRKAYRELDNERAIRTASERKQPPPHTPTAPIEADPPLNKTQLQPNDPAPPPAVP
ncbi:MAG: type II secretion system secretin GspD [Myxococcota bacterium]